MAGETIDPVVVGIDRALVVDLCEWGTLWYSCRRADEYRSADELDEDDGDAKDDVAGNVEAGEEDDCDDEEGVYSDWASVFAYNADEVEYGLRIGGGLTGRWLADVEEEEDDDDGEEEEEGKKGDDEEAGLYGERAYVPIISWGFDCKKWRNASPSYAGSMVGPVEGVNIDRSGDDRTLYGE